MFSFGKSKGRYIFTEALRPESKEDDGNPSKGWYGIYPFALNEPVDFDALKWSLRQNERLAMVQADIGAYKDRELDDDALDRLDGILGWFADNGMEIILRIMYDRKGRGMEREPSGLGMVQRHMEQAGAVISDHADSIFVIQGLFVGNWGEMHGSKFLSDDKMCILAQTLLAATSYKCRIAVRKPQQWRVLNAGGICGADSGEIGLYNDGILASDTDMGTYAETFVDAGQYGASEEMWMKPWEKRKELEFQKSLCRNVPNGGEVVCDSTLNDFSNAAETFKEMHITYLNSQYDMKVLEKWKRSSCDGSGGKGWKNGYEWIGAHLGYRYVVKSAEILQKDRIKLQIIVENTGFSNIYEDVRIFLEIYDNKDLLKRIDIDSDARSWNPAEDAVMCVQDADLAGILEKDKVYGVFLGMRRKKDGCVIRFANEGASDTIRLGEIRIRS
ncbi:MAG: DUF4832 domain-containing protein [Clostridia bacterium]|nr:DUF4832 domain-containing protein [Clostridia bacterium]